MNNSGPKISVLMSVYNAEKYLHEAISSVLAQTFGDFEFVIVNDASTDSSGKIISEFKDPRIKVLNNETNLGLTKSLNIGLRACTAPYVARLDADDIALPNRFEKQYKFMEDFPEFVLVGSWVECIDFSGKPIKIKRSLTDPDEIRFELIFENTFVHSTIFFRRAVINNEGNYNEAVNFNGAEDFEMYTRLADKYLVTNLPEVLVKLRLHEESIVARPETQAVVHKNALALILSSFRKYVSVEQSDFDNFKWPLIVKRPWKDNKLSYVLKTHMILKNLYRSYIKGLNKSQIKKIHARYLGKRNMIYKLYLFGLIKNK